MDWPIDWLGSNQRQNYTTGSVLTFVLPSTSNKPLRFFQKSFPLMFPKWTIKKGKSPLDK